MKSIVTHCNLTVDPEQPFGVQVIHRLPMLHKGDELHHSGALILMLQVVACQMYG